VQNPSLGLVDAEKLGPVVVFGMRHAIGGPRRLKSLTTDLKEAVQRVVSAIENERLVRLLCCERGTTHVVHLDDVLFLRTEGGYTHVQTEDAYFLMSDALATIAKKLPRQFVRVHRNAIVNLLHVKMLGESCDHVLMGRRGIEVAVSRRFRSYRPPLRLWPCVLSP